MEYCHLKSPIGLLLLAGDSDGLKRLSFPKEQKKHGPKPDWIEHPAAFKGAIRQLNEYFNGSRKVFTPTLCPEGTPFQLRVWQELQKIPYGSTISYGELARRVGNPKASRAVGAANGVNPIAIIIPCHRVIGSNGHLTGFGGGLDVKQKLLELENAIEPEHFKV